MKVFLLLLPLFACGYPLESYQADLVEASCELALSCGTWDDHDACVAAAQLPTHPGCTYEPDQGARCVDALASATCAADGTLEQLPDCAGVWSCP